MKLFRRKKKEEEKGKEEQQEVAVPEKNPTAAVKRTPQRPVQRPPPPQKHQEHPPPPQQRQHHHHHHQNKQQQQQQHPPPLPPKAPSNNPLRVKDLPPPQQGSTSSPPAAGAGSAPLSAVHVAPVQETELKTPPPPTSPPGQGNNSNISSTLNSLSNLEEDAQRNAVTRELVKKFVADIWNRGDLELIPQVCSKSLRFNGSVGMDRVGHDGFARMVTTIRDALNDYHCEIHSMVVEGGKAFCRMRFTGRHTGSLLGFPPTGRQVAWMGAAEFTCKDGKIIKVWELGDVKSLEDQLSGN